MKVEKGVVVVAWNRPSVKPRFLVLKRKKNWEGWELPKGHLENDDYKDTVRIELSEEASLEEDQIQSIETLDETLEWTFKQDGEEIKREYRGFLVRVDDDVSVDTENNPSEEHEHGYFFNYSDASSMLTYDNQAELLDIARDRIEKTSR